MSRTVLRTASTTRLFFAYFIYSLTEACAGTSRLRFFLLPHGRRHDHRRGGRQRNPWMPQGPLPPDAGRGRSCVQDCLTAAGHFHHHYFNQLRFHRMLKFLNYHVVHIVDYFHRYHLVPIHDWLELNLEHCYVSHFMRLISELLFFSNLSCRWIWRFESFNNSVHCF